ncbi:sensor histidine kinase [Shewanella dokdonensis]|uniref:histidine kinase n=1 Tax=Shewanella dokdonensis TaxID=712036 RepID=A0ABX8DG75_9GAMM|nr:HAMP domain-containing sensor histidine kinase [Shewanella dokdonensis]MCL1073942.1 HAMP domain-containing histidine kinase [Shewanella dokdonensis]QVK23710.1 HAMP domain-containing histidine kinase [Shewanella dokdonensis]
MAAQPLAQLETISHRGHQWIQVKEAANMSNRMGHILQAMPSGVVILNGDGIVTDANPVAESLLDIPLVGERWLSIINRSFAPRKDDGHEVSLRNGRRVKLAITPLTPEPGQLIMITDLTETRLLQQNLSHLQRLSALGKMVANLAHQIRTPLSAALLYASNLGNPRLDQPSRHRFQEKLLGRLGELERQVNDMLLIAKGKQEQLGERVQMSAVVQQVMMNCEPICGKRQVVLTAEILSDGEILANLHGLSSAINNLVMNSVEAQASEIVLQVRRATDSISLTVADNGHGLDKKLQHKVLEPFYTTKTHGTGLGLAVVQSVVKSHGGQLSLSCEPGQGCSFTLMLPLIDNNISGDNNA